MERCDQRDADNDKLVHQDKKELKSLPEVMKLEEAAAGCNVPNTQGAEELAFGPSHPWTQPKVRSWILFQFPRGVLDLSLGVANIRYLLRLDSALRAPGLGGKSTWAPALESFSD